MNIIMVHKKGKLHILEKYNYVCYKVKSIGIRLICDIFRKKLIVLLSVTDLSGSQ